MPLHRIACVYCGFVVSAQSISAVDTSYLAHLTFAHPTVAR